MRLRLALLPALLLLGSCSVKFSESDSGDGDADADTDADSDADSDSDTDTDADPDAQVEDCDEVDAESAPSDDCVVRELSCGDAFVSTTEGSSSNDFNGEVYEDWFCAPTLESEFEGADVTYTFTHPGTGDVYFYLDSPCGDLGLFTMYWADEDECPVLGNYIQECDSTESGGTSVIRVWNNEPWRYLVVVDSQEGEEGAFGLSIECADNL